MKYDKIIRAGINGSGNIVIEQILNYLLDQTNQPIDKSRSLFYRPTNSDDKIIHTFRYIDNLEPANNCHKIGLEKLKLGIIVPIRDFRSVLASQIRKRQLSPTISNIKHIYNTLFRKMYQEMHKYITHFPHQEDILILEYAKYFNDLDYAISKLKNFLEIEITNQQRNFINKEFSIEANKKVAQTMQSWSQIDTKSGIHGQHIGNGHPDSWKTFFPNDIRDFVNDLMEPHLKEFGFEI